MLFICTLRGAERTYFQVLAVLNIFLYFTNNERDR